MTNCKGNTALHIAASLGHIDMSELLITRAIDQEAEVKRLLLKAQNVEQNTALQLAVKHGHCDIVDLLIRKEPGLTSITNKAGESPKEPGLTSITITNKADFNYKRARVFFRYIYIG